MLSDRYSDATVAYQGAGRGFPPQLISEIVELATEGLRPDLTLLFDLSVTEGGVRTKRRTNEKQQGDRLDAEDTGFHTRVRDAYLKIAAAEPDRIKVIETTGSVEETHAKVKGIVSAFLKTREQVSAKA